MSMWMLSIVVDISYYNSLVFSFLTYVFGVTLFSAFQTWTFVCALLIDDCPCAFVLSSMLEWTILSIMLCCT